MECINCEHLGKPEYDKLFLYPCNKKTWLTMTQQRAFMIRTKDDECEFYQPLPQPPTNIKDGENNG